MEIMIITMVILVAILAPIYIKAFKMQKQALAQLQRYWDVEIGMTENEMLSVMGGGFNRSLLKDNRVKYEWRINATSYGSSYNGFSTRSYTGVKKVTIYTKNGFVEEVKTHNV